MSNSRLAWYSALKVNSFRDRFEIVVFSISMALTKTGTAVITAQVDDYLASRRVMGFELRGTSFAHSPGLPSSLA